MELFQQRHTASQIVLIIGLTGTRMLQELCYLDSGFRAQIDGIIAEAAPRDGFVDLRFLFPVDKPFRTFARNTDDISLTSGGKHEGTVCHSLFQ